MLVRGVLVCGVLARYVLSHPVQLGLPYINLGGDLAKRFCIENLSRPRLNSGVILNSRIYPTILRNIFKTIGQNCTAFKCNLIYEGVDL